MSKIILMTGGARSGKSRLAEEQAQRLGSPAIYIATARIWDDETQERVDEHRARRVTGWRDIEAPIDLARALRETDGTAPRLVDCLTMWLTNLMMEDRDLAQELDTLLATLSRLTSPVVFVTNEVGMGIVPENALARRFRDAQGHVNQKIAALADEVYLVTCGYALKVKPQ
ncbi:bifunctional adenosylcobinamide kinase/adenosylcobinamide-phosphate guanylyltransferase [Thioclava litoralis]|uniref:Bifunctional adenosylcobalamin biosynthesis protein n=1 Tax=Thioclava litoralis TaxID=3076557 RepID=A0ABZ1DYX1_9RHOB|nr:bifunctional adenosylcobinamide kinase/adenosylcobinamide-phosphate guanylyltransferase [Thioclava sp. FTW29]